MQSFLQYVLKKVNNLNMEFQSEHFCLQKLYFRVSAEYKKILSFFIKKSLVQGKMGEIDPIQDENHKNVPAIYLGAQTMTLLEQEPLPAESVRRFKKDCLKFLVKHCLQCRKQFQFSKNILIAKLRMLDPITASDLINQPPLLI